MAILPDWQIRARCESGMVTPFDPDSGLLNPASLDVRLGPMIMIETAERPELLLLDMREMGVTEEDPYMLRPGQFILAETMERFSIPEDIAANFILKSSRARSGIDHLYAGFADPGFHSSVMTLELRNVRQLHSIPIFPGMKIGQMVFHLMAERPIRSYAVTGSYNGDLQVTASKN